VKLVLAAMNGKKNRKGVRNIVTIVEGLGQAHPVVALPVAHAADQTVQTLTPTNEEIETRSQEDIDIEVEAEVKAPANVHPLRSSPKHNHRKS